MKLVKRKPDEGQGMNMTPMIDVVFQLLIFFMLVTEMTQQELAELKLPRATEAVPDKGERGRHTINVVYEQRGGEKVEVIKVGLIEMTLDELEKNVIIPEARIWRDEAGQQGTAERPAPSEKPILIRADQSMEFGIIQHIMARCVKHGIYRISFAAMIGEAETGITEGDAGL